MRFLGGVALALLREEGSQACLCYFAAVPARPASRDSVLFGLLVEPGEVEGCHAVAPVVCFDGLQCCCQFCRPHWPCLRRALCAGVPICGGLSLCVLLSRVPTARPWLSWDGSGWLLAVALLLSTCRNAIPGPWQRVWGRRVGVWGLCRGRVSVPASWPLGGMR